MRCQEKCKVGTFPDGNKVCNGQCLNHCDSCDDNQTCNKCSEGFFKDAKTDSANHSCVNDTQCPATTYADMITGNCEDCDATCKNCDSEATMCTECPAGKFLLDAHHKCFTTCPRGTYQNGTECSACQQNVLDCDPSTGAPDDTSDDEKCASNCNGCIWSKNYCIECAAGYKRAANGRCVMQCPDGTIEDVDNGTAICRKCGEGCTRCLSEGTTCDGDPSSWTSTTPREARCVSCDKDLDYFLFRDH